MIILYRIEFHKKEEHKNIHVGPYSFRFSEIEALSKKQKDTYDQMLKEHRNPQTHPDISRDFNTSLITDKSKYSKYNYYCGCPSLSELKSWFKGYIKLLKGIGFIIAEYKVKPEAFVMGNSEKQCFFRLAGIVERNIINYLEI